MANELQPLSLIFQNRIFRIPDYQRGYAWQTQQLLDFWEDLNNLQDNRNHYTGLLSLKELNRSEVSKCEDDTWVIDDKGYKPFHIVDGQQRLTTFIILINEIIEFVRSMDENNGKSDDEIYIKSETLKEVTNKYIFQRRPPNNQIITYLFGYEKDNPSYEYLKHRVLGEPYAGTIDETYYTKNLGSAKDFFANNLHQLYDNEGIKGIEKIYLKLTQHLKFNIHEISDDYDVFVAFETMNNRGKRLTNLELLKNRLIYLTTIYPDEKLDAKDKSALRNKINNTWKEIYYQLGRNKNQSLSDDDFLRDHWIIYFAYSRQKGDDYIQFLLNKKFTAKNIFEKKAILDDDNKEEQIDDNQVNDQDEDVVNEDYNEELKFELEPKEIEDYINSLKELAEYWYYSFFPDESSLSKEEKLWVGRLNRIGIGYFRPLVVTILFLNTNVENKLKLFKNIERFIFIKFRLGKAAANYKSSEYYKKTRELYHSDLSIEDLINIIDKNVNDDYKISLKEFVIKVQNFFQKGDGYYSWNSLKYFMYEYEYSLAEVNKIEKVDWKLFSKKEDDRVTIEHILPQKPTVYYWKNLYRQFNNEEMTILTGALGNLLPLSQSINSSLQNDSFDEKKNPTKDGRRGYSSGSNSEIEVSKLLDWGANQIYKRTLDLFSFMQKRWEFEIENDQLKELCNLEFVNDGRVIPKELDDDDNDDDNDDTDNDAVKLLRQKYWENALPIIKSTFTDEYNPFKNVTVTNRNKIDVFFNLNGVKIRCNISIKPLLAKTCIRIYRGNEKESNEIFDKILRHKDDIQKNISSEIIWDKKVGCKNCEIYVKLEDVDFRNKDDIDKIARFHADMSKELLNEIINKYRSEIE